MAHTISIADFLERSAKMPVVDVRSPGEFEKAHIPGARNIPMFDDAERKVVGTAYKQINREAAIYAGLDFMGAKMVKLVKEAERVAGRNKTLLVHCWRGGMRSQSMAWLFETIGITCFVLEGGYKTFRAHVREVYSRPCELRVVGGRTGSGKTAILHRLEKKGEQVIDLEGLANHKGSAFGALGEERQPSTEQFENDLSLKLSTLDPANRTWIEDESRNIGKCVIPGEFYEQMRSCPMYFLDISRELRAGHLVKDYAGYETEDLKKCVLKIERKLGGDRSKEAIDAIERADFYNTAMITLHYYDKAYMFSLDKNHKAYTKLESDEIDPELNASLLLGHEEERGL